MSEDKKEDSPTVYECPECGRESHKRESGRCHGCGAPVTYREVR
jgi:ribosomal protein L37E